jgi:hypothetical protein
MSPKAAAAAVTVQTLYDTQERMDAASSPSEADFKVILSAARAGPEEKALAAQLITRYHQSFPKLTSQVVLSLVELSKSEDLKIRKNAVAHLPKLLDSAKSEIATALFYSLGDADPGLATIATTKIA